MRRPVGVKWSFLSFRGTRFFSRRVANVATLPFALFLSDFRSVQFGCSRFSRCCHLIIDLPFHPENGSWARRLTQSPELGAWAFSYPRMFFITLPPAGQGGCCCATVRILLRSPTND